MSGKVRVLRQRRSELGEPIGLPIVIFKGSEAAFLIHQATMAQSSTDLVEFKPRGQAFSDLTARKGVTCSTSS